MWKGDDIADKQDSRDGFSLAATSARFVRKTFVWYVLFSLAVATYFTLTEPVYRDARPITRLLSLPPDSAEGFVLDLWLWSAPVIIAVAVYVRLLNKKRLSRRRSFVSRFADRRLVQARSNPDLVYLIKNQQPVTGHLDLQLLWAVDGAVNRVQTYDQVNPDSVDRFDPQGFIGRAS